MTNFALKVKKLREKLGLSQEEFARQLNMSWTSVSRWENGKCMPLRVMQSIINDLCKKHKIED